MDQPEVILGILGGAICGALLVGTMILGFLWWQSRQRIKIVRENLSRNPTLVDGFGMAPIPPYAPQAPYTPPMPFQPTPPPITNVPVSSSPPYAVPSSAAPSIASPPPFSAPTPAVASPPPPPPPPAKLSDKKDSALIEPVPHTAPDPKSGSIWLDGIGGVANGQRYMVYKEQTILGRSGQCDIQFHDPKVSRQHALLRLHNNEYWIQDMQSSRGTIINGSRVENHRLQDRDQVRLGDTIFLFRRN